MVLPAGTSIPPLPHLLVLLAGAAVVGWLLRRERPAVTADVVLALAPWMVVGASLHVIYQIEAVPASIAPFLGSPSVYLTTAIVAGAVWLLARRLTDRPEWRLGVVGAAIAIVTVTYTLVVGGVNRVVVPSGALVVGIFVGVAAWWLLRRVRPEEAATVGAVGLLVVFAHALDGVSTAAGVDLLGFGERTPASRVIMEVAGALPTVDLLGVGWLFVLVKVAVAAAVVVLFAEYVREEPTPGYALLGLIAAVGLGPGAHNLLLFAVAG